MTDMTSRTEARWARAVRFIARMRSRFAWHALVLLLVGTVLILAADVPSGIATAQEMPPPPASPPQVPGNLSIKYGETASIDDGALQLAFVHVDEDSRCPKEVLCVWQGRAQVQVHAILDGVDQGDLALSTLSMTPSGGQPGDVAVGRYALKMVGLTPYPSVNAKPAPEEYVLLLDVARS